jgi:fibrillin 1
MAQTAFLFSLVSLHVAQIFGATDTNACSNMTYIVISDVRRSTAYNATDDLCDRGFIKDESWYRFQSAAGNKMPEENPGPNHCGTYVPIWMNGDHPDEVGTIENRIACAGIPWTFPVGCGVSYKIQVINCGTFYLYNLREPDRCTLAYCAGMYS